MKCIAVADLMVATPFGGTVLAAADACKLVDYIKLPDNAFDCVALNPANKGEAGKDAFHDRSSCVTERLGPISLGVLIRAVSA